MILIDKQQLKRIESLVHEYSGILFARIAARQAERKILEQMKRLGFVKVDDYIESLKSCLYRSGSDMDDLIAELTVSESSFFRNPEQFNFLYQKLLPELYQSKRSGADSVKIWSAGCARGEEAYSIAMIAKKFKLENPAAEFFIMAGDINQKNIQFAKSGEFNLRALRNWTESFEEKLGFKLGKRTEEGICKVSEDIKKLVSFRKLNLRNLSSLSCMSGSDIIFCRNVLIYFSEAFRIELLEMFYKLLLPGGIVFLGESECLPRDFNKFELISYNKSYAYKKPDGLNQ